VVEGAGSVVVGGGLDRGEVGGGWLLGGGLLDGWVLGGGAGCVLVGGGVVAGG
jgi:hypothetical protein